MPTFKEAAVPVVGTVFQVERVSNFETKEFDGLRVGVIGSDGLFNVRVKVEHAADLAPVNGQAIAWMARYGAWSGRNGEGQTTLAFERVLSSLDADGFMSAVGAVLSHK